MSSRNWVFTVANPESEELPRGWTNLKFCVWQMEEAASGLKHLQGYAVFSCQRSLATLKNVCPGAHWEVRRGTHHQAKAYATKEETRKSGPWTFGEEPTGQGARSDLTAFKEAMDNGQTLSELMESNFTVMMKFSRFAKEYLLLKGKLQRDWMTFTTVLWGPPGSGKTRRVLEQAGKGAFWMMKPGPGQTPFFDGYEGQEDIVLDEFYGWLPFDLLCRICDRYPLTVQTKGGACGLYPRRVWITSNKHPREWYRSGLGAMERRLSAPCGRIEFVGGGVPEPLPCLAKEDDRPVALVRAGSKRGLAELSRAAAVIDLDMTQRPGADDDDDHC